MNTETLILALKDFAMNYPEGRMETKHYKLSSNDRQINEDRAALKMWTEYMYTTHECRSKIERVNGCSFETDNAFEEWANSLGWYRP